MKRFLSAIVVIVCISAIATAETEMYVNVKYGSSLNVREISDTNSRIVGSLVRGQKVTVSKEDNGFMFVLFVNENKGGWVSKDYILEECPEMLPIGKYKTTSKVKVRNGASYEAKIVMYVNSEKSVTVKGFSEDTGGNLWAKVNGGYIALEYLKLEE